METRRRTRYTILSGAALAGLTIRAWCAWHAPVNYDLASYSIVVDILHRGRNVYADTFRYNYAPPWMYCLWALHALAGVLGLPFVTVVRLALGLVDVAAGLILAAIGTTVAPRRGWWLGVAYLLNPIAIEVSGYHGQFEPLACLPLLAALLLTLRRPGRSLWLVWLLATLSLLIKHVTVFEVWLLLVYAAPTMRRAALLMAGALAVFAASFAPFWLTGWVGIINHVLRYQSFASLHAYGLTLVLPPALASLVLYGALGLWPMVARWRGVGLPVAWSGGGAALVVLLPALSSQQLVLPLLLTAVPLTPAYWLYTLTALGADLGSTVAFTQPGYSALVRGVLVLNLAWLGALVWLGLLTAPLARDLVNLCQRKARRFIDRRNRAAILIDEHLNIVSSGQRERTGTE